MNKYLCEQISQTFKSGKTIVFFIILALLTIITVITNSGTEDKSIFITAVLPSIVASLVIIFVYQLIDAKEKTIVDIYNQFGLKNIYVKKADATADFKDDIRKAKQKIWAIGMTNKSFLRDQTDNIVKALEKKELDIKIVYWNDCVQMGKKEEICNSIIDIQSALEKNSESINPLNTIQDINTAIKRLQSKVHGEVQDFVEVGFLSTPSSFSCLVVDDNVYFFPFLNSCESNITPFLLCDANKSIGKAIIDHFKTTFQNKTFYISRKLSDYEDCSNRG